MPSFKETYAKIKEDTANGEKHFNVVCESLEEGMQTQITLGASKHIQIIDTPAGLDGTDKGPSPLLNILGAIGACIIAVTKFWAKIMEIEVTSIKVNSRGHINLASIFGIDDSMLAGYDDLEPIVTIKSPAPKEKIEELMEKVWTHCPIVTNFNMDSKLQWKLKIKE
ncbi:MAG: OsmC family protein [archaeon]|nr:OsmC family protein [archaeon]